jgi:hypothetical protein
MKLTKRKGFNFFRSYFDVYNELNDKEKVMFIDALLDRQFLGIKPTNLTGMAKFAYISQTNSIDSQVKGFEDKTGIILNPTEPPTDGGNTPPTVQVEGKGEVQEEVKGKGDKTLTLGSGKHFFSVTTKYANEKAYIVKGVDGLNQYMELNKSILDFPDQHEKFMRDINGDVFNEFMHVKNRFKKFIQKQYA